MKKIILLVCCSFAMQPLFSQSTTCYEKPLFPPMPKHSLKDCWSEFKFVMQFKYKTEAGSITDTIIKGPFHAALYRFDGQVAKRTKDEKVMKYYAALIKKEGGEVYYQDAYRVDARINRDGMDYWINVAYTMAGELKLSTISGSNAVIDEVQEAPRPD